MSSVSAACIFGAYSASSAHTDTFYIVSQIVRVRNSKRHFFSKLTFRISFNHSASPYGNIDHSRSASPYGHIDHSRSAFTLRQHRPQPPCLCPTATSTTTALPTLYGNIDHNRLASPYDNIDHNRSASPYGRIDHNRSASPYGNIDHNRPPSPYGRIDHNRSASPYGNIDHSPSFRTTKPFEQL